MSSVDSFSHLFPHINQKLIKCEQILSLIGLYFVTKYSVKLVYKVTKSCYIHLCSQIAPKLTAGPNDWAVITFVSNRIGLSFAQRMAERGFNLILIDANEDILRFISNKITFEHNVQVMTITADFNDGLQVLEAIERQIKAKEITVLVNNVSLINQLEDNYCDFSPQQIVSILNTEVSSVLLMTSIILPLMRKRQNGFIINVSSILSATALPHLSLHSATKAFVDRFSTALSYECKEHGIRVQSLMPSVCSSNTKTGMITASHQTYARFALNTIGFSVRTTGYLWHEFHYTLLESVPQLIWPYLSVWTLSLAKKYLTANKNQSLI